MPFSVAGRRAAVRNTCVCVACLKALAVLVNNSLGMAVVQVQVWGWGELFSECKLVGNSY